MTGPVAWRTKQVVNVLNGSTLLGAAAAAIGGARLTRGPRHLLLAHGYRWSVPPAAAFAVGNVVLTRHPEGWWEGRDRLLRHEERHTWQYVACLGLPMLPLYLLAAAWSMLRGGGPATHNPFERLAGLEDGGYGAPAGPTRT